VRVVQAEGSGDDAIVALVRELSGRRVVVTADRELRRRCEAAGAEVFGPSWLIGLAREH
jgi:rRNA-processing protein FCF1